MGQVDGFMRFNRATDESEAVEKRLRHNHEFTRPLTLQNWQQQGARCMNCGVPFCHSGCPLGNLIPDFNDAVYRGRWRQASELLYQTNNFPEFTGRLCPAPCEEACVLNINDQPVAIENIEKTIAEQARANGWMPGLEPQNRTGKQVAIIGSGPAGLAAAEQLNRAGHLVTVFEQHHKPGGLLRYGIPDFKLEKQHIDHRVARMESAGITFTCDCQVGIDVTAEELRNRFDAVALCTGASQRRELAVSGRDATGVMQAMDYLTHNNRVVSGEIEPDERYSAQGKRVIVIGGGDTGSDCVGTALRQGARSVHNFEIMPKPAGQRPADQPWPFWPIRLRTSTSHQEGGDRHWALATQAIEVSESGAVSGIYTAPVKWRQQNGQMQPVIDAENSQLWACDLVLLAMGFTGADRSLAKAFETSLNPQQLFAAKVSNYQLSQPGLFAAGDCRRGQSLIVWAIAEGRELARQIDLHLMGTSDLPSKGEGDLPGLNPGIR